MCGLDEGKGDELPDCGENFSAGLDRSVDSSTLILFRTGDKEISSCETFLSFVNVSL